MAEKNEGISMGTVIAVGVGCLVLGIGGTLAVQMLMEEDPAASKTSPASTMTTQGGR